MHILMYLLIRVRQAVLLCPEEQAQHVRLEIRPPNTLPDTTPHALYELLRGRAAREVQPRLLVPLLCRVFVENALGTHPLKHLKAKEGMVCRLSGRRYKEGGSHSDVYACDTVLTKCGRQCIGGGGGGNIRFAQRTLVLDVYLAFIHERQEE